MKHCRVCKAPKEESEFAKCASRRDGLQAMCRVCSAVYHREKRLEDVEGARKKGREQASKQREKHRDKLNARNWEWRQDPLIREKMRVYAEEYRKKHPEYSREYRRLYPDVAENTRLKTRYGITLEEKNLLFVSQGGGCAVCKSQAKLDVDHDHKSGKVRGLLCRQCNTALGSLKESPVTISALLEYVKKHS